MSTHSYSRCWLHLIWETLRREPMLDKRAAAKASANLSQYSYEKGIYMKINFFNADHTHALIDLPTNLTIEQVVREIWPFYGVMFFVLMLVTYIPSISLWLPHLLGYGVAR